MNILSLLMKKLLNKPLLSYSALMDIFCAFELSGRGPAASTLKELEELSGIRCLKGFPKTGVKWDIVLDKVDAGPEALNTAASGQTGE
jgi:hypothetical protein